MSQLVFGYGSLLDRLPSHPEHPRVHPARLRGYRRTWNIAMDNSVDLPGYKYYVTPDGERPPVFVTFLNLAPHAKGPVNGIVFEVTAHELDALDLRERNYERVDVTRQVEVAVQGQIWAYLGNADARGRYETGVAQSRAVVSREYFEGVRQGFAAMGPKAITEFDATTDAPACPMSELLRIDLTDDPESACPTLKAGPTKEL